MAAKRREDSSSLAESLEILLKTLDDIERRNVHLLKLCGARRNLFKPWPRKKNGDTETVEKDGGDVQTSSQSKDTLTAAEKSEMAMMDKMLTKAQAAREVQQRIKESGRTRKPKLPEKKGDNSSKGPVKVSNQEPVQNDSTTTKPSVKNLAKKTTSDRLTHNLEKGTNSKSQGDQVAPKSSTTGQGQGQRGRLSGRGSSSASVRGGKKVVAAHLTAPFQTNPRLSVPKRQVDKRISSGAKCRTVITGQKKSSVPTQRSVISEQKSGFNQKQNGKDNHKLENQRLEKDEEITEKLDTFVDDDSFEDKATSAHNSSVASNQSEGQEEETQVTAKPLVEDTALVENLGNLKVTDDTDTQEKEKEKRFCLLTDGKKLNIPGKLRRLYANNVRLREKVKLQRMTKKVDVCTSRQEFLSKVESTFEWDEAQSVGRKVQAITNVYTNLLRLLCDLDLRDTDSWPCYDVLRAKRMVEFILTVFYKTEEERLKFNPDVLSSISCEGRQLRVEVTPPQPSFTSQFWSPAFIKLDPCVYKTLSKPYDCLQYKSSRDLDRYMTLVFQIQYEQLQQRLLDTIATKVLPLLKCGNYKPSETVWMFRSLYSMLTSNKSFPVIVKDTIQELEESPENK
ncbi:uncharacterized protein LOC110455695 [Mizuhopecten yessoensis]|uniref:Uncharacterized protein n=1 Tax=Mizuhopecten yessoensis TaxID=6573 RepID=A0A210QCN5_MIZYE|nr:uncharacterized protein LOC110455695 [Mizuhopecten yessoensis]OWF46481.1 hypothetical protein KP79_PYT05227 [Mizuhopecten yessoensis]